MHENKIDPYDFMKKSESIQNAIKIMIEEVTDPESFEPRCNVKPILIGDWINSKWNFERKRKYIWISKTCNQHTCIINFLCVSSFKNVVDYHVSVGT